MQAEEGLTYCDQLSPRGENRKGHRAKKKGTYLSAPLGMKASLWKKKKKDII